MITRGARRARGWAPAPAGPLLGSDTLVAPPARGRGRSGRGKDQDVKLLIVFFAGLVSLLLAFAHPIGPALVLLAISPFDALFYVVFGPIGNLVTWFPIIVFFVRTPPGEWARVMFGTPIMKTAALFVLLLSVSHAYSVNVFGLGPFISYGKKITFLFVLGFVSYSLRDSRYVAVAARVLAICMALYTLLSGIDFYLGLQILPVHAGEWEQGALGVQYESWLGNRFRFSGAGLAANRFAIYLILPTVLSIAWVVSARRNLSRLLALGCLILLPVGVIASASRSALLGLVVATLMVMVLAFRMRLQNVVLIALAGSVLLGLGWLLVGYLGVEEGLGTRLQPDRVMINLTGRIARWLTGVQIWVHHPFIGVGDDQFKIYSEQILPPGTSGTGAHSAYANELAERGLLGFIPFIIFLVMVAGRYMRSVRHISPELDFWRPYFFAAFIGVMVTNVFGEYFYERMTWLTLSFAISLEHVTLHAASRARASPELREYSALDLHAPDRGTL
jgi:hypothetical protein